MPQPLTRSPRVTSGESITCTARRCTRRTRTGDGPPRGRPQFTLKLEPENLGVLLRRKLDYAFPNQRAEVFVADASRGQEGQPADWKPAGIWYLAGSNTCVYSNPKQELGAAQHLVQTSNRRFRDDEFLIPRGLTAGRTSIRVRVQFTPVKRPLYRRPSPGRPGVERDPLHRLLFCHAHHDNAGRDERPASAIWVPPPQQVPSRGR